MSRQSRKVDFAQKRLPHAPGVVPGYLGSAPRGIAEMQCGTARMQHGPGVDLIALVNSSGSGQESASELPLMGFVNTVGEIAADGANLPEWLDVPFADVPYHEGTTDGIERLNREVAERMVALFNSWRGKLARAFGGMPVYLGHPDHGPSRQAGDTNDDAHGWVQNMGVTPDSLRLDVEWTPPGIRVLQAKTRKWFSPFFLGTKAGRENGVTIYEPRLLKSVGLTNRPRWPVAALVNAEELNAPAALAEPNGGTAVDLLNRLLALIGKDSLKTEDDLLAYVGALINAVKKMIEAQNARWAAESAAGTALANAAGPVEAIDTVLGLVNAHCGTLDARIVELTNGQTAVRTEADTAIAALTAEKAARMADRTAVATLLVNAAITDGRVLPADRDTTVTELVNAADLGTALSGLAARAKAIKTESVTRNLGKRDATVQARREQVLALVNARMDGTDETYESAFAAVQAANPALFANPELKEAAQIK